MGGYVVYMFEFLQTDQKGERRTVDVVPHTLASLAEAKMLAGAMLKHTTFVGVSADAVVIKDQAGGVFGEVKSSWHKPKRPETNFRQVDPRT
jgi:hypothetical protein